MQGRTKPLSLLSATTLGCTLALGAPLALPQVGTFTAAQAQENQTGTESRSYVNYEGDYVIAGVHTEMLNAFLDGNQFTLGTLADTAPGQQGRFNPAHTVFHLPDVEDAHTTVAAGYDYIAPEGTDIFYIPSTRTRGLLYPGLGAEGIRPGALKGDTINLELVRSSVPEGGRAEVFTESGRDNPRVFSTNDQLAPHTITAGGHEHLSWAFTRAGIYQLTFRATATLTDGTPVSSEATYTIAVGTDAEDGFKLLNAQNAAKEATKGATSEATTTPEATSTAAESATGTPSASTSASAEAGASAEASASTGIRRMDGSVNGQNAAQVTDPNGAKAAANGEQASQDGSGVTAISGADNTTNNGSDKGESKGGNSHSGKGSSVKGSNAQNVTAPGNNSGGGILSSGLPGSLNQQCIATEVPAEDAKDSQDSKGAKDSKQNAQAAQAPTGIPTLAVVNTAEHSGREEVTHGHFDVGPVLNGGTLTSSVKDDRTSPARHVSPGALEFVLNDAAKLNLPAGMEDIAPAGTPVYMIGATQQQGVPWLGWSTQDPELLKQLDGPVTMSLNGFEGPGTLSTFLSGNFGSAGQKVFDSRSGGSFQVPANTHQHSNWVFTAEGRYTVTIGWTARLKNGQQVSSESVLHFTVGNPDNAPASNNAQGAAGTKQDGGEKSTAKNPLNGTVDEATGIVTKPDGSKVRIVGKTASGEDCALTSQELANAQKAAAAGKLPNTGVVIDPFMVSTSILALALGAMALRSARRKGRSGDAA